MAIKKYSSGQWVDTPYRKYGTETDTITSLPKTIIGDGQPISSFTINGNMTQSGKPTPTSPIYPQECGDLVSSGEHSGEYVLPIVSGSVTTNVYLNESLRKYSNNLSTYTDSFSDTLTRFVKKIIIDGNSSITKEVGNAPFKVAADGLLLQTTPQMRNTVYWYCSHYPAYPNSASWVQYSSLISWSATDTDYLRIRDTRFATLADFKNWLQEQSYNGTPVTIWYVLETPTTETVTAPTIPTTGTAQSFDVDTTLKPSEVSLTYHGWHEHNDTKYT